MGLHVTHAINAISLQIVCEIKEYNIWKNAHEKVCTARYQKYSSVQLESALAPLVVQIALERGVIFSGLVTDGDTKTHNTLALVHP